MNSIVKQNSSKSFDQIFDKVIDDFSIQSKKVEYEYFPDGIKIINYVICKNKKKYTIDDWKNQRTKTVQKCFKEFLKTI